MTQRAEQPRWFQCRRHIKEANREIIYDSLIYAYAWPDDPMQEFIIPGTIKEFDRVFA